MVGSLDSCALSHRYDWWQQQEVEKWGTAEPGISSKPPKNCTNIWWINLVRARLNLEDQHYFSYSWTHTSGRAWRLRSVRHAVWLARRLHRRAAVWEAPLLQVMPQNSCWRWCSCKSPPINKKKARRQLTAFFWKSSPRVSIQDRLQASVCF